MPYVRYMDMMVEASAPLPPAKYWEHHDCPWTPLRKPVAECNVAILGSAGVHMKSAPPFEGANDWSYRLVSSDTAVDDLTLSHPAPIAGPISMPSVRAVAIIRMPLCSCAGSTNS